MSKQTEITEAISDLPGWVVAAMWLVSLIMCGLAVIAHLFLEVSSLWL